MEHIEKGREVGCTEEWKEGHRERGKKKVRDISTKEVIHNGSLQF